MASLDQSGEHPQRLAHLTLSDFLASDDGAARIWIASFDALLAEAAVK